MKGELDIGEEKVFKIHYHVNLLSCMSNEDGYIMEELSNCDELSVFRT